MFAGANGFAPIEIDASGYDLVVIDTPHFIRLKGVDRDRVLSVVHDIIPLQDPTMSTDWRTLFLRKLEATLDTHGTMIFVSETTRDAYYRLFPGRASEPHAIIYPPVRRKLMKLALAESAFSPGPDLSGFFNHHQTATSKAGGEPSKPSFDQSLPYFVTPTSDEARKNVNILIKAFRQLRGVANLVIVGQVDMNRYTSQDDFQNIIGTGYISDELKNNLIHHSAGLIFPSFSEGFGIPIIEGGILRRPVICSRIRVFEEISAGHALYFDPADSTELASAVSTVLHEPEANERRIKAFFDHILARFSQEAMATEIGKVLKNKGLSLASEPAPALEATSEATAEATAEA